MKHIVLTGAIGAGKSTALLRTLALLGAVRAEGVQTYAVEPREAAARRIHMRAWGDDAQGRFVAQAPGGSIEAATPVFDELGTALLERAQAGAQLIVVDEIGRLERDAHAYHAALRACIEGDVPMLCALRREKADWADWIRAHERVLLLEVTQENRDSIPQRTAAILAKSIHFLP